MNYYELLNFSMLSYRFWGKKIARCIPLLAELVWWLQGFLSTAIKLGMCLECGIPRSGAACNHCAGLRQEIKWRGNYRNWGGVQYSEFGYDWKLVLLQPFGPFTVTDSEKTTKKVGLSAAMGENCPVCLRTCRSKGWSWGEMNKSSSVVSRACRITKVPLCYGDSSSFV